MNQPALPTRSSPGHTGSKSTRSGASPSSLRGALGKIRRIGGVLLVNILIFALLFAALEIAYRIHREGLLPALGNVFSFLGPDDSDGKALMIADSDLGYRLNP